MPPRPAAGLRVSSALSRRGAGEGSKGASEVSNAHTERSTVDPGLTSRDERAGTSAVALEGATGGRRRVSVSDARRTALAILRAAEERRAGFADQEASPKAVWED